MYTGRSNKKITDDVDGEDGKKSMEIVLKTRNKENVS